MIKGVQNTAVDNSVAISAYNAAEQKKPNPVELRFLSYMDCWRDVTAPISSLGDRQIYIYPIEEQGKLQWNWNIFEITGSPYLRDVASNLDRIKSDPELWASMSYVTDPKFVDLTISGELPPPVISRNLLFQEGHIMDGNHRLIAAYYEFLLKGIDFQFRYIEGQINHPYREIVQSKRLARAIKHNPRNALLLLKARFGR